MVAAIGWLIAIAELVVIFVLILALGKQHEELEALRKWMRKR